MILTVYESLIINIIVDCREKRGTTWTGQCVFDSGLSSYFAAHVSVVNNHSRNT